jgi:hypothetical protein
MTTRTESEIKPTLTDPVSDLFYRICGQVSVHILISKAEFKIENDVEIPVFNFDNKWEVEYKFYDTNPENKNFEIILRTLDSGSWIPSNEITLTLFNDGGTNIRLKDMRGNKPNFSSRDIKSGKELREKFLEGSSLRVFEAFPDLDFDAILEVKNVI